MARAFSSMWGTALVERDPSGTLQCGRLRVLIERNRTPRLDGILLIYGDVVDDVGHRVAHLIRKVRLGAHARLTIPKNP
jgi:hypothetical protein